MNPVKRVRRPLFLDPDRYRRRRLMDAARLLPVLGGFLFLLPVLWQPGTTGHNTAVEGVYLFAVWAGLILLARLFAPGLAAVDAAADGRMVLSMLAADGTTDGKAPGDADAPPEAQDDPATGPDPERPRDGKDAV